MPTLGYLTPRSLQQRTVSRFLGYHRALSIDDGEFYDMENLTGDYYPLLASRAPRIASGETWTAPQGLAWAGGREVVIDGGTVYYGGTAVPGLTVSADGQKQLVQMGAYVVIFPDGAYFSTLDTTDCGGIDNTATAQGPELRMCDAEGVLYTPTVSASVPADPQNGDAWLDTGGGSKSLKIYSEASDLWVSVPTVYTKLLGTGLGAGFEAGDGVTISGFTGALAGLNGSHVLQGVDTDWIVVTWLLDAPTAQSADTVTVARLHPLMDYVISCQNRLWGCRSGPNRDGETVNEIYASALGSFKNWGRYQGLSTDSYAASCGSAGAFTGAYALNNYPLFFKADRLHKVYVSSTGAHKIIDQSVMGVKDARSLAEADGMLYYTSAFGVCAYDGEAAGLVGDALHRAATDAYDAIGCARGGKYYLALQTTQDAAGPWTMFVYSPRLRLWHRESAPPVVCMAASGQALAMIGGTAPPYAETYIRDRGEAGDGQTVQAVDWYAVTGLIGYTDYRQKYISRVSIRMVLPKGSECRAWVQYDHMEGADGDTDSGRWEPVGTMRGRSTRSFLLPIRPRRCDHFRLKLTGRGDVRVYSIAYTYESGSDISF